MSRYCDVVSEFLLKLGQNIARKRLAAGFTQEELAFKVDMERPNITRLESGRTNPTITTLNKIAEALDVPLKELVDLS